MEKEAVLSGIAVAVLAVAAFGFAYRLYDNSPDLSSVDATGWYRSEDQHYYRRMARELSQLRLETYHFGLGYPVLGALFFRILPADPYLVPNTLITVWVVVSTFLIGTRLTDRPAVGIAASVLLLIATPLIWDLILPWNSTIVIFWTQLVLMVTFFKKPSNLNAAVIGMALGWIFAARYIDILWLLPLIFVWLRESKDVFLRHGVVLLATAAVLIVPILVSHYYYFQSPFATPYVTHRVNDQSFSVYRPRKIGESLVGVFITGTESGFQKPLIVSMPILWFVPLGIRRFIDRVGTLKSLALALGFGGTLLFYGAHPAFSGWHLRYGALHYIKIWFPPFNHYRHIRAGVNC